MTFMYSGTTCARVVPATITPNRKRENKRAALPLMDTSFWSSATKVEQISHPEAFAFEIGRVGRSRFEEGKKRETILGSPENRASPPETHGSKFLNSLFRASLRWDQ